MGEVASLDAQRKRHDDGRCWEPGCDGIFRVICPSRGQHSKKCPHESVTPARPYRLHGFIDSVAPPRCRDCGEHLYPDLPDYYLEQL